MKYLQIYEPCSEKTSLRGFRPGSSQTYLYSHWRWLETWNFVLRKKWDFTICLVKNKVLISCAVIAQLIFVFVFVYAIMWFSKDEAPILCIPSDGLLLTLQSTPCKKVIKLLWLKMSLYVRKPTIWILTRSDTNQAVQILEMARGLKFYFRKKR